MIAEPPEWKATAVRAWGYALRLPQVPEMLRHPPIPPSLLFDRFDLPRLFRYSNWWGFFEPAER